MGVTATSVVDRAFEETSIRWTVANVDGDQVLYLELPVGFGDCALLEASAQVSTIATIVASHFTKGPVFQLFDTEATALPVDVLFTDYWRSMIVDALAARAAPDQVQFWRPLEVLRCSFVEVDTNVAPTADLSVIAKVRRLRPEISRTPEETHFFLTS